MPRIDNFDRDFDASVTKARNGMLVAFAISGISALAVIAAIAYAVVWVAHNI